MLWEALNVALGAIFHLPLSLSFQDIIINLIFEYDSIFSRSRVELKTFRNTEVFLSKPSLIIRRFIYFLLMQ